MKAAFIVSNFMPRIFFFKNKNRGGVRHTGFSTPPLFFSDQLTHSIGFFIGMVLFKIDPVFFDGFFDLFAQKQNTNKVGDGHQGNGDV